MGCCFRSAWAPVCGGWSQGPPRSLAAPDRRRPLAAAGAPRLESYSSFCFLQRGPGHVVATQRRLSEHVDVHSCHLLSDHFQFTLIHGPNIPGSYAILLFTASDFTSITSHIHNWALFLLWFHLFLLSGVISLLFSSSILSTY